MSHQHCNCNVISVWNNTKPHPTLHIRYDTLLNFATPVRNITELHPTLQLLHYALLHYTSIILNHNQTIRCCTIHLPYVAVLYPTGTKRCCTSPYMYYTSQYCTTLNNYKTLLDKTVQYHYQTIRYCTIQLQHVTPPHQTIAIPCNTVHHPTIAILNICSIYYIIPYRTPLYNNSARRNSISWHSYYTFNCIT